ncbi:uncharacterized protein LOC135483792 [Lineus longissimus]|uniref:uncharacterized protein LOC135483792 n=1 Tax=Lineus longissimus TaxID=88925 RepID=UPI002B4E18CA
MGTEVLLYVPNIIGYVRLILLVVAYFTFHSPSYFLAAYIVSATLDYFDGLFARKLGQTSAFGAWFDIVIDNLGRGMLWCRMYEWGYFVAATEWLVFVCTHTKGTDWKSAFAEAPPLVKGVMSAGFKSPLGFFAIAGIHVLPIWLYAHSSRFLAKAIGIPVAIDYLIIALLSSGRALCFLVELFCLYTHISYLLSQDTAESTKAKAATTQQT